MTNYKETIKDLRRDLLEIADSLGISEETLWNLSESDSRDTLDGVQSFIYQEDHILIDDINCLTIFNYIHTIEKLGEPDVS